MKTASKILGTIALLATVAFAADKPNFSGEWVMDASKSNLGPMALDSMTMKIDHQDPNITVTQTQTGGPQGDQTTTAKYTTDGKESTNQLMGNDVKSTAKWDGDALVIASTVDFQGNPISLTSKWSLSEDGKVLTNAAHISTGQGDFDMTYVLNKK